MIRIENIKHLYNFEPKYTFSQFEQYSPQRFGSMTIHDGGLYKAVRALTKTAYPTEQSAHEKRWQYFFLPLKRRGYFIVVPLVIIHYDKRFFLNFPHSQVEVCKGDAKDSFYLDLIEQTMEFSGILKKDPGVAKQSIPYDIRTGRVLGKYVMVDLLPAEKKIETLKLYAGHIQRGEELQGISLNDYLNIAAVCYKAAFGRMTDSLTEEQMYRKWADGRDCEMLEIKNKKSSEDFSHWARNKSNCGGHPFEIIYSWQGHGIHLYPQSPHNRYFVLSVTDYGYAMLFLEIVRTLIRNRIPFKAHELNDVLDYLSGETYFTVNTYEKHHIFYTSGDRKLIKHIEWDDINMLKWK